MKAVIRNDGLTSVPAKVDFATDPNLTESWLQHALFDAPHADALNKLVYAESFIQSLFLQRFVPRNYVKQFLVYATLAQTVKCAIEIV